MTSWPVQEDAGGASIQFLRNFLWEENGSSGTWRHPRSQRQAVLRRRGDKSNGASVSVKRLALLAINGGRLPLRVWLEGHVSRTDHVKDFQRRRDLEAAMPSPLRLVAIAAVAFALLAVAVCGLAPRLDQAIARPRDAALTIETPTQAPVDEDKQVFPAEFKLSTQAADADASPTPTVPWSPPTPELTKKPQHPVTPTLKELRREPKLPRPTTTAPAVIASTPAAPPRIKEAAIEDDDGDDDDDDEPTDKDSLYYHQTEYDRIRGLLEDLEMEIQRAQDDLKAVDAAVEREWRVFDEQFESVMQSSLPSPRGARVRNLKCMGWKRTGDGTWKGPRQPADDKSCFELVSQQEAIGYCVVRDEDTDEYFRVMRSDFEAILPSTLFACRAAAFFANFPAEIERVILEEKDTKQQSADAKGDGIVLVVQPGEAQQAVALVEKLRGLQCELPVELWLADDEVEAAMTAELHALLAAAEVKDGVAVKIRSMMARASPVAARVHAISHSSFESVLYLDVATTPLRDPTYLFSLPQFVSTGTLFWPSAIEYKLQPASLVWEYLDMEFVDMFGQDDRQLLIRRDLAVRRGLGVVELFATHQPDLFTLLKLVEDDKDFFRLAWLKSRVPFHMVAVPPAFPALASERLLLGSSELAQHDPNGEKLFLHRQRDDLPFPRARRRAGALRLRIGV